MLPSSAMHGVYDPDTLKAMGAAFDTAVQSIRARDPRPVFREDRLRPPIGLAISAASFQQPRALTAASNS